jgi:hypothetical protein
MSSSLAIAAVTATLRGLLDKKINIDPSLDPSTDPALAGTTVTTQPPDKARGTNNANQINLFLYQTSVNGALRNMDMPRQVKPGETGQPPLALNLYYLVTAYGRDDDDIFSHRLLGRAMSILHDHPVLGRDEIENALPASDLNEQLERVRITDQLLSVDELSKLWTTYETPYRISAAYQVSLVLIESTRPTRAALPVRERTLHVLPFQRPLIETVSPQISVPGGKLTIHGQNLKGDITKVSLGATQPVDPDTVGGQQIEVTLPADLLAGINTVQVQHLLDFGTGSPSEPHRGFESNVAAFILAPQITTSPPISAARGTSLSLAFTPPVGRSQPVALLVGDRAITIPPRPTSGPPTATTLNLPIPLDLPAGEFLLRLRVDGADSPLQVDTDPLSPTFNQYIGPKVTIT